MDFEKLYEENYKMVYYVCLKFFKNEEDAEDMTQNIFIKAFDKISTLSDINKFTPWIRQIANRECINELQRRGRFTFSDENVTNEELNLVDDKQKTPEEIVVEDDVRDIILEIINKLPQDQRIAIYLYYYQDMTVKEISEVFNCPEQTTRSRLAYARKNMKKEIEKLEDKGVRIRTLNILPFLYCIFQAEEELVYADIHIPEYNNISEDSASTVTSIGKKSILSTVGGKIAIGVAVAAVVVGGIAGAITLASKDDKKEAETTIQNGDKPNVETQSTTMDEPEEIETTDGFMEEMDEEVEYINNTLFGSNCIVYESNQITIKDVLGVKEDIELAFDEYDNITSNYYNNDEYLIIDFKDNDSSYNLVASYIIALSNDGNLRYKSEKHEYEPVINNDGNLVYIDNENNLTCINLSTGEEVYKTNLSYLEDSSFSINHISSYMLNISSSYGYDNYVYNILTGSLIYELTGQRELDNKDIQKVVVLDDTYIVYDIDEDVESIEGKFEAPIKKFTTYDINGNAIKTSEEKLYIRFNANAKQHYMLVTKEMNGQYVSGFFKSDMTPVLDYTNEIFALDTPYTMYDMDMIGNDEGICYVLTKDMSHKIVYESPYRGTFYILKGIDGKTYFYSMSGNELVEISNEAEKEQETWFAAGIYNNISSIMKLFYECNSDTGEINIYVVDGDKIYSGNESRDEYELAHCLEENNNHLIYLGTESALIMNYETKQEYKIEEKEILEGKIVGVVNDKYYLYYTITEKDEKNSTYTLKAYNLETKEIKDIYEKDLINNVANNSYYIFNISDYGFITLNNDGSYEINKLELK